MPAPTDADAGQSLTVSIVGGEDAALFQLSGNQLQFINAPNFEAPPDDGPTDGYQVTVQAADAFGGVDSLAITVTLTDVDEFDVSAPVDTNVAANTVAENAAIGALVGLTAQAGDADATTNAVSYSLTDNAGGRFAIDATTGVVTVAGALDFETAASADGSIANTAFSITVTDVSEAAPPITGTGASETLRGTEGNDVILALGGNDTLLGLGGADLLNGGPGRDTYDGGAGDGPLLIRSNEASGDTFRGGTGFDTLKVAGDSTTVTLNGLRVTDIEAFDGSGRVVRGSNARDVFDFSTFTSVVGVISLRGQGGNDEITGNALTADQVEGGQGDDTLIWNGGNDTFVGGSGNDTFRFLNGSGSGDVTIQDFDRSGNDVVQLMGFGGTVSATTLRNATDFTAAGALLDLEGIGGSGSILFAGIRSLSFSGSEDFLIG
jgi:Ca2+-binding RTX toxin-like protein